MDEADASRAPRVATSTLFQLGVPVATVVAFVLRHLRLPWMPTYAVCLLGAFVVVLAVELARGIRGPDRSPLDRRR